VVKQDLVTALHPQFRIDAVLDKLTAPDNRLLVTSEVTAKGSTTERMAIVDVAHEALIRHWTLLRQWIETNRDRLRQQRRIESAAVEWREQGKTPGYLLQGLPLIEAKQFQKQQAQAFPLSQSANHFIQKSIRRRQINRLKTASWLIIPALLIGGVIEYQMREEGIKADYERLNGSGYEERQAVEDLVEGCYAKDRMPQYFAERLFGNCRSLFQAPLAEASLSSAVLRFADLRSAVLSFAVLSSAVLRSAVLSFADLRSADLSYAFLRSADLRSAVLSSAILLATDFRNSRNLTAEQFTTDNPPLLCNVALPPAIIEAGIDPNRDCDDLPQILSNRYSISLEDAQSIVDSARQKQWDEPTLD
jgi:uncharacterized protein YjbI with pentapeptide repeats